MGEKSRLIKNTVLISIGNFGAKAISFLLLPLYTSILSPDEYGTYDFIVAVSMFLIPCITVSMHEAMFRFIIDCKENDEKFKKIVSNAFFIVCIGIILLAVALIILKCFYSEINYLNLIFIYVMVNSLYTFLNNILRGLGKMKQYTIVSSGKNILQLILNVICILNLRLGMKGLIVSTCFSESIAILIIVYICKLWTVIKFKYISLEEIKPLLKYSFPLIPNSLGAQIIHVSDRIIISGYLGTTLNGIYSISYKFPNMVETIYHFFYIAWSESASRIFQNGKEKAQEYYQNLYDTISKFMFAVILCMIAGMSILFRIFIKGQYLDGFVYIPILMIAIYLDCIGKFYSGICAALKKTKVLAISTVIAALANIIINIVFIKTIGLYAAAISTLIAEIILVIIRKKFIENEIKIVISKKSFIFQIIMICIMLALYTYDNITYILISIILAAIYSLYTNKELINEFIKKIKKRRVK